MYKRLHVQYKRLVMFWCQNIYERTGYSFISEERTFQQTIRPQAILCKRVQHLSLGIKLNDIVEIFAVSLNGLSHELAKILFETS